VEGGDGPGDTDQFDEEEDEFEDEDDEDGEDSDGERNILPLRGNMLGPLAQLLGSDPRKVTADPQAQALVQAAQQDDVAEIDRLLAEGVPVDAEAPGLMPGGQPMAGLGVMFPGGPPRISMTPLLAAVVNKKRRAAERLLDAGADPNRVQLLFGAPVHAAAGAGEVELLQLLLDRGGDVGARNARGQTPLQVVAAGRASRERLAQAQALMKSMGVKLPGLMDQLTNITLPEEGWDACERLLKAHGAR
jgi:hypothetical protein